MSGSTITLAGGSALGSSLTELLLCDDIQPGTDPSYQICKLIFLYHPLGDKMVTAPLTIAQSQARKIVVSTAPGERVAKAFVEEWSKLGCDKIIFNVMRTARIYGASSVVCGGGDPSRPLDVSRLAKAEIYFNVLDPLNTAGSLVLNQNPNDPDFQKHDMVTVQGERYHRSRTCIILNEEPIYIAYTSSAFGFSGRSVYQRALFPLKSYIQTMKTDDMVSRKAGVLVAKLKGAGSIADRLIAAAQGVKRSILQQAQTDNVISVNIDETIESLNMQNVDSAMVVARKNILENIAAAAGGMPAMLLNSETFAQGLAEGTEDAKKIAQYIDRVREQMEPLYRFFTNIVQFRAWSEEFYDSILEDHPEYKKIPYRQAFYEWVNSFSAEWPSLLTEPESEQVKVADVKLKSMIAMLEVLIPAIDPANKATLITWAQDNINELKLLFSSPLVLDFTELEKFLEEQVEQQKQMAAQGGAPGAGQGGAEGGDKAPPEPPTFSARS